MPEVRGWCGVFRSISDGRELCRTAGMQHPCLQSRRCSRGSVRGSTVHLIEATTTRVSPLADYPTEGEACETIRTIRMTASTPLTAVPIPRSDYTVQHEPSIR